MLCLLLAFLGTSGVAMAADEFQNWHSFQWHAYKTSIFDASVYGEVRFREDASELYQSLAGPKLTLKAAPCLDLGLNYSWIASRNAVGDYIDTHRLEMELNPHFKPAEWVEVYNRNRLELYWTDGNNEARYRSRNRLQFTFPLKHLHPVESVYCSNEFWYDFYRNDYVLNRAVPVGVNLHLGHDVHLSLFYMIQSSKQTTGTWNQAHILGTSVAF